MQSLTEIRPTGNLFHPAPHTPLGKPAQLAAATFADWPDPMEIVRGVELPRGLSLLKQIEAVQFEFEKATGRDLDWKLAVDVLDQIKSEREGMPFPTAFAEAACYLKERSYSHEAIHEIVGHISRRGTVVGCNTIHSEDLETLAVLIPRHLRRPSRERHFEAMA